MASSTSFSSTLTQRIVDFLRAIGLHVQSTTLSDATFLPGIEIHAGALFVDETKLAYPGDLLHEAGHLATLPGAKRELAGTDLGVPDNSMLEVAAIAWSYAAALHLGLDPAIVFHEGGYRGHAAALLRSYALGVYPGVQQLIAMGLTGSVALPDTPIYPAMIRWVRGQ